MSTLKYEAIAQNDTTAVYIGTYGPLKVPILELDVGLLQLGGNEGVTDALSDAGWEQLSEWRLDADGRSVYCEVARIQARVHEADDNLRRMDAALALVEEDEREGVARPLRDRVDSAMQFERDMRDRKEFPQ